MTTTILPTFHTRMMRAQTYVIPRTFRDATGAPVDLTRAIVDFGMRADMKLDPTVMLTSISVTLASLQLIGLGDGLLDTLIQAKSAPGTAIAVALVGDSGTKAGSLTDTANAPVLHYLPGQSTVADVETLINASTQIKVLAAGATATQVLDAGTAFAATNLVLPSTGYRQGVVINPDQNSFRGQYTITLIPSDTSGLTALGDDDPWLHEAWVQLSAVDRRPDYTVSRMGLYAQAVKVP